MYDVEAEIYWGAGTAPNAVKVIDAAGTVRTPTVASAIAEAVVAGSGVYKAVITLDEAWGLCRDYWSNGDGKWYPGDRLLVQTEPSDILFNGVTAGGNSTTHINFDEVYDAANAAKYTGQQLYLPDFDGLPRVITAYGNAGSGASFVEVASSEAYDSAPPDNTAMLIKRIEAGAGGGGGSPVGPGADPVTVTITRQGTGTPIADADVWISTDAGGTNVVAGTLQTNSLGEAVFMLDAGLTYRLWMQKDGENSILGQAFVAAAD
jgi:hypothetical protein